MRNSKTSVAHPQLTFQAEMQFACLYAMRHPALAADAAHTALSAAHAMQRPDLAYQANELLAAINRK